MYSLGMMKGNCRLSSFQTMPCNPETCSCMNRFTEYMILIIFIEGCELIYFLQLTCRSILTFAEYGKISSCIPNYMYSEEKVTCPRIFLWYLK